MKLHRLVIAAMCSLTLSCSGAQTNTRPRGPITARDYFPLRVGAAWSYDTDNGLGRGTILSAMSVVRADGERFIMRVGARSETYERRPDGITREGDYLVHDPIRVGTTWPIRSGGSAEIRSVGQTRTVSGQRYRNVIEVFRSGGPSHIETTTWYSADVGAIEVSAQTTSSMGDTIGVRSLLRAFVLGD
jgi:hypothetical protein